MAKTCIVIGGGTSGLIAGALLAKEGYAVTVLEKNLSCGGGLQMFSRSGTAFETGMHVIAGHNDGIVARLLDCLGIRDRIAVTETDTECSDSIHIASEGRSYKIPRGKEAFIGYMSGEFPNEAEGIRAYVEEMFRIYASVPLVGETLGGTFGDSSGGPGNFERAAFSAMPDINGKASMPADEFVASYITDPLLRALFGYMNLMSGAVAGRTPAYVHAVINALYIEGTGRLDGGPASLVKELCGIIAGAGGRIVCGERVTSLRTDAGRAVSVATEKGNEYTSDIFLWACGLRQLSAVAGQECFSRGMCRRLDGMSGSFSVFVVFIRFKSGTVRYANRSMWWHRYMDSIWHPAAGDSTKWPSSLMYMTPPSKNQGVYADRMIIMSPMDYQAAVRFDGTGGQRRGEGYAEWKAAMTEKVLGCIESMVPGLRDACAEIFSSSPLTVRDWYGAFDGAMYGMSRSCADLPVAFIPPLTRLGNMFIAGQDAGLHGLCGAAATSLTAFRSITGKTWPDKSCPDKDTTKTTQL